MTGVRRLISLVLLILIFLLNFVIEPGQCCENYPENSVSSCSGDQLSWSLIKCTTTNNPHMLDFMDPLNYAIQTIPIAFTVHPKSTTGHRNVELSCAINTMPQAYVVNGYKPHIEWKKLSNDGRLSTVSNSTVVTTVDTYSTLHNIASNGTYYCVVDDGNYTIQSAPAIVIIKEASFANTIYSILPGSTVYEVTLSVSKGNAVILDCTTDEIKEITWNIPPEYAYNITPNTQVMILPSFEIKENSSFVLILCNYVKKSSQVNRFFNLYYKKNVSNVPHFVVSPKSHDIPIGSNLTLYCQAESTAPVNYSWSRNGDSNWYNRNQGATPIQALILNDVTVSANYTCIAWNEYGSVEWTAEIRVYRAPNVSIHIESFGSNSTLPNIGVVQSPVNLNLSCNVDNEDQPLKYKWYFRGKEVTSNSTNPVVYNKSLLVFHDMRMENALGSVQCLVEGLNGWGSDNVRIIIQDKPNPPGPIAVTIPLNPPNHTYTIQWASPHHTPALYELRMLLICNMKHSLYRAMISKNCAKYNAKRDSYMQNCDYNNSNQLTVNFYVAAVNKGTSSDYTSPSKTLSIKRTLPSIIPLETSYSMEKVSSHEFQVTFSFKGIINSYPMLNESYIANFYKNKHYYIDYQCGGVHKEMVPVLLHTYQASVKINCCQSCRWRVFILDEQNSSTVWNYFTTPSITPEVPLNLSSSDLKWNGSEGTSFLLTSHLPSPTFTCNISHTTVDILCPNGSEAHNFSADNYNFSEPLTITFSNSSNCWEQCYIFYYYTNPNGTSPTEGQHARLPSYPSEDIVKKLGDKDFSFEFQFNEHKVNVSWTIPHSYSCMIRKYLQTLTLEMQSQFDITKNYPIDNPQFNNSINIDVPIGSSSGKAKLTFYVQIDDNKFKEVNSSQKYFSVAASSLTTGTLLATTSVLQTSPTNTGDTNVPSSTSFSPTLSLEIIVIAMVGVIIVLTIIFCLVCFCVYSWWKKRTKHNPLRRGFPEGSDVEESIVPLLLDEERSVKSEETECKSLIMDKFLDSIDSEMTKRDPKDLDNYDLEEEVMLEVKIPAELEPTDEGKTFIPRPKPNNLNLPGIQVSRSVAPLSNNRPPSTKLSLSPALKLTDDYCQWDNSGEQLAAATALNKAPLTPNKLSSVMEMDLLQLTEEGLEVAVTPTNPLAPQRLLIPAPKRANRMSSSTPSSTPISLIQPNHLLLDLMSHSDYLPHPPLPKELRTPNLATTPIELSTPTNPTTPTKVIHMPRPSQSSLNSFRITPPHSNHSSTLSLSSCEGTNNSSHKDMNLKRVSSFKKRTTRDHTKVRRRSGRSHSRSSGNSSGLVSSSSSTDSVFHSGMAKPTTPTLHYMYNSKRPSTATSGFISAPTTPRVLDPVQPTLFNFPANLPGKGEPRWGATPATHQSLPGGYLPSGQTYFHEGTQISKPPQHYQLLDHAAAGGMTPQSTLTLNNSILLGRHDDYLPNFPVRTSPTRLEPVLSPSIEAPFANGYLSNNNLPPFGYSLAKGGHMVPPASKFGPQVAPQHRHSNTEMPGHVMQKVPPHPSKPKSFSGNSSVTLETGTSYHGNPTSGKKPTTALMGRATPTHTITVTGSTGCYGNTPRTSLPGNRPLYNCIPTLYSYNTDKPATTSDATSSSSNATTTSSNATTTSSNDTSTSNNATTTSSNATTTSNSATSSTATGINRDSYVSISQSIVLPSTDSISHLSSLSNSTCSLASISSSIENFRDNPQLLESYPPSPLTPPDSFPSVVGNDYV